MTNQPIANSSIAAKCGVDTTRTADDWWIVIDDEAYIDVNTATATAYSFLSAFFTYQPNKEYNDDRYLLVLLMLRWPVYLLRCISNSFNDSFSRGKFSFNAS
jgi:hypothetical protein